MANTTKILTIKEKSQGKFLFKAWPTGKQFSTCFDPCNNHLTKLRTFVMQNNFTMNNFEKKIKPVGSGINLPKR